VLFCVGREGLVWWVERGSEGGGMVYIPSVSYDDVVEGCVTFAEAGEADLDNHVARGDEGVGRQRARASRCIAREWCLMMV